MPSLQHPLQLVSSHWQANCPQCSPGPHGGVPWQPQVPSLRHMLVFAGSQDVQALPSVPQLGKPCVLHCPFWQQPVGQVAPHVEW